MAAYGGHGAVDGNQIFCVLHRKDQWPPATADVRLRYEQTIGELRAAFGAAFRVHPASLQLFHHKRELTAQADAKTLLDMQMHTGFALKAYDLSAGEPAYDPPVEATEEGLRELPPDA